MAETAIAAGVNEFCVVDGMKIIRKDTEFMKASQTSGLSSEGKTGVVLKLRYETTRLV